MVKAADWLANSQDPDGCWRRFRHALRGEERQGLRDPCFAGPVRGPCRRPGRGYQEAGMRQVDWALEASNCPMAGWTIAVSTDAARPLTHTLGYALRGIIGAYESSPRAALPGRRGQAGGRLAGAAASRRPTGRALRSQWRPAVSWVCLTGLSQIAECWFLLARATGNAALCRGRAQGQRLCPPHHRHQRRRRKFAAA